MIQVIKRNGKKEDLQIGRIREVATWACEGLAVNELTLEAGLKTRLRDGITTREIQDSLIQCALENCTLENSDYRYVAGRLLMWSLWKDTLVSRGYGYEGYIKSVNGKLYKGIYDKRLEEYNYEELKEASSWLDQKYDLDYDYAGALLLTSRYLLPDELPQEAFLTCALLLALSEFKENRLEFAKQVYLSIAQRKISLATPILANLRVPNGSLTSCFIITADDNLESIYRELTNTARISKNGGGVGVNLSKIRATGAEVMGKANASNGVISWIKLFNDTAVAVNQGGKRSGAVTVGLDIWHYDIPEFLELQTENGDQRRKAYDVFPQVIIPDLFMERVKNNQGWTFFDPYEIKKKFEIDLSELWGEEFTSAYQILESYSGNLALRKTVNARELFKDIMKSQVETGMPYLAFKDTINKYNANKHDGYIPQVNLCVAGETKILTDAGQFPIADLAGQNVNVWNGFEWSNVLVKQTGTDQPLLKVHFSNGEFLECTYYHKFHIQNNYRKTAEIIDAKDLKVGDKLIKYRLPLVESENDIDFPYAYTSGFFSGDGSHDGYGKPEIDLYGEKKQLLPLLTVRNKYIGGGSGVTQWRIEQDELAVYHDIKQDRIVCKLPLDIPAKFTVPLNGYTITSRLEWLAGILDSDGCVTRNGTNESLQISSIHKEFLLDIRLMLQTLGVDSKVTLLSKEGYRPMPNGKGGYQDYFCQTSYRLLISSVGLFQLSQLGLKTNRLQWQPRQPQRESSQFISVTEVELTCRKDDTYCFNEPKRHLGMFNGILTGQCTESFSNVASGKYAHCCNLVSLNLANIENAEELANLSQLAVNILDNTIDLTLPPFEDAKAHNDRYRTIGVGTMGLADYLAKHGSNYSNLDEIGELYEIIAYNCILASALLAGERGKYFAYDGSDWSKELILSKPLEWFEENGTQDWESLFDLIHDNGIRNSMLMAIAPNTSSSLVQGCTASVLPCYSKFYYDKWSKGTVPIAPPFIKDSLWYYRENKTLDQNIVVKAVAEIQKWIDTGISMELVFNLNEGIYGDNPLSAKDMYEVMMNAWESECKAVYYTRIVQKDDFKESCVSCAN